MADWTSKVLQESRKFKCTVLVEGTTTPVNVTGWTQMKLRIQPILGGSVVEINLSIVTPATGGVFEGEWPVGGMTAVQKGVWKGTIQGLDSAGKLVKIPDNGYLYFDFQEVV